MDSQLVIYQVCACVCVATVYLESQQAAVDLGSLNQSATIVAADVRAALVAGQIDQ